MAEWHEILANIATMVSLPVAAIAIIQASLSQRRATQIERGTFMLEIEKMLAVHDRVHLMLRPGGAWTLGNSGPESAEDWAAIDDYMGLFEHCELLMQDGTIDPTSFSKLFRYRVVNIVDNNEIVQGKLISENEYWATFIELCERLKVEIPASAGGRA